MVPNLHKETYMISSYVSNYLFMKMNCALKIYDTQLKKETLEIMLQVKLKIKRLLKLHVLWNETLNSLIT